MSRLAFLDTETTGLDFERHEVWEIGLITRDGDVDTEYLWQLWPDLQLADPTGLRISRFYEREQLTRHGDAAAIEYESMPDAGFEVGQWQPSHPKLVAAKLARLLDGRSIIGAVPSFDANFLTTFLRSEGQAATWHYHLVDVENVAVGYLAANAHEDGHGKSLLPPYSSDELAKMCGVASPTEDERHTALGDAKWVRRWWDHMVPSETTGADPT